MLALLFGAITAGSVPWNAFSTQKKLVDLTDRVRILEPPSQNKLPLEYLLRVCLPDANSDESQVDSTMI